MEGIPDYKDVDLKPTCVGVHPGELLINAEDWGWAQRGPGSLSQCQPKQTSAFPRVLFLQTTKGELSKQPEPLSAGVWVGDAGGMWLGRRAL